ncbi:MAG: glycosyltransferase family 2 protein [Dokdonella sp.]|uniref:glycosyltransferase family 2 protein n=1 Tax=Dokdonella sp. TaxID=2291710 RepID=UPI0032641597
MTDSLVSIVMPVYNAAATLCRSIDSVLAQSHTEFELLAVDDGSNDASPRLLDDYAARDPRVHALRMPANGGVAAARNHALAVARGNYIAFLDSDDGWHPDKLARQLAELRTQSAQVSYTAYDRVAEDGSVLSRVRPPISVTYADMLKSNRIGNLTGMYDRTLGDARFQNVGHEDYVFWLERVRRAGRAICVDPGVPLAWYLVRAGSVSSNKIKAARWQWHIYRHIERLGLAASIGYMAHYVVNALRKRA